MTKVLSTLEEEDIVHYMNNIYDFMYAHKIITDIANGQLDNLAVTGEGINEVHSDLGSGPSAHVDVPIPVTADRIVHERLRDGYDINTRDVLDVSQNTRLILSELIRSVYEADVAYGGIYVNHTEEELDDDITMTVISMVRSLQFNRSLNEWSHIELTAGIDLGPLDDYNPEGSATPENPVRLRFVGERSLSPEEHLREKNRWY